MSFLSWRVWLGAIALVAMTAADPTVAPANYTVTNQPTYVNVNIQIAVSRHGEMVPDASVMALTDEAANNVPPTGISGPVFLANVTNELQIPDECIAYISCDPSNYPGNIDADDVFQQAESQNVSAVVFYTVTADYCSVTNDNGDNYPWIYTMKSANGSQSILTDLNNLGSGSTYYATIGPPGTVAVASSDSNNGTSTSGQNQQSNPLGPSPSTAVAMIILYSITGVITALFLVIIVTGAVRAHRHPERYGPRNIMGRARQSRARGLARAMLDGLPIVKFGEREEAKPGDVELADAENGSATASAEGEHGVPEVVAGGASEREAGEGSNADHPRKSTASGIAAATTNAERSSEGHREESQGCSICTDDFEIGQDQRVLPCNHKFHPACIDPWLLNVSGTCPLCRIDLRPQTSETDGAELDEDGNPIHREGDEVDGLAPPLGWEASNENRHSLRRSFLMNVMGLGRPAEATREERVLALRRLRLQQAAQRRAAQNESAAAQDEGRTRRRLRDVFGIRTKRSGTTEEAPAPVTGDDPPRNGGAEASGSGGSRT